MQPLKNQFIWAEKYRPQTIADCILPTDLKSTLTSIIKQGETHNLLFFGGAGIGKTSAAKAICQELDCDYLMVNGSKDGNIDTLRTLIQNFASTVSIHGGKKIVILDEADYLNAASTQPALRGFMEEFAKNCRFIMTCNFVNKIIKPIHSRCSVIKFDIQPKQKKKLMIAFLLRVQEILEIEKITFDKKVLAELVKKFFPDMRRILNELQRYSVSGTIDVGILSQIQGDIRIQELAKFLKEKDFAAMRKWVVQNMNSDPVDIYRSLYDNLVQFLKPHAVPQAVIILADYQFKNAFVADTELCLVSCLTEMMADCDYKD